MPKILYLAFIFGPNFHDKVRKSTKFHDKIRKTLFTTKREIVTKEFVLSRLPGKAYDGRERRCCKNHSYNSGLL
jgi:hypothetical protein